MGSHALTPLLAGTKTRITALHQHAGRLYAGCADGSVKVYELPDPQLASRTASEPEPAAEPEPEATASAETSADETTDAAGTTADGADDSAAAGADAGADAPAEPAEPAAEPPAASHPAPAPTPTLIASYQLSRREITQVAILPEAKQLAVLSDSVVTLYALDNPTAKGSSTVLSQARTAHAIAVTTYFALQPSAEGETSPAKVARDLLVVGCRKKVCVYGAGRVLGEVWEMSLPHSPRTIVFPATSYTGLPIAIHLLYSPQASVLLHIRGGAPNQRLAVTELPTTGYPPTRAGSTAAAVPEAVTSAFTSGWGGLGGYMLGKGAAIPVGTRTVGGEALLVRDDLGVFFSAEGNFTRTESLQWPTAPEAMAFANPNIYSVVPAPTASALPSIHVHLAPTLALRKTITFPSPSAGGLTLGALSVSSGKEPRVLIVSTPTDRSLLAEGSTIWELRGTDIGEQVDELVREGRVTDAIGLVEAVGDKNLAPTQKLSHLRVLHALAQFARGEYKAALEAFLVHNVHPAKVVALYPKETVSGNLAVPRDEWMALFGATEGARLEPPPPPPVEEPPKPLKNIHLALGRKRSTDTLRSVASTIPPATPERPTSPPTEAAAGSPDVKGSPVSAPAATATLPRAAIDELIYYLSDRRQKLAGITPNIDLPNEKDLPPLSALPAAEVHALPNGPLSELTPEQLLRTAQVVYTSLLKVYLVARPSLVGSLCRIENWCDVAEVEPLLREKGRIDDLRDLYMQKQMHDKALSMLYEQAQDEDDPLDRYPPTVRYLEKLGPAHLDLIFASSKWIFKEDPARALQIFTADEPEVDALPRAEVAAFLEAEHWSSAITYLEHVIELGDTSSDLHDKLAELYLRRVREPSNLPKEKKSKDSKDSKESDEEKRPASEARAAKALSQLLDFLNSSTQYRAYRLLSSLNKNEVPAVRAVLLGRMGNHDEALKIYVYTLKDYVAAETYCSRVYAQQPDPKGIFLHLLKLYLRPAPPHEPLVPPALDLVGRHGPHLDAAAVLALLPPLVPVKDLHDFFVSTLGTARARRNEHRIVRGLLAARKAQTERLLLGLEVKRVRVTDQRICPQCHKRLGQSAIAVHAPRGEVTHLHCKDLFSAKLEKARA